MTRRKLLIERGRISCARFFEGLRGDLSPTQLAALPRMKALSQRCGYGTLSGRGHRRTHKRQSRAMRRFKLRIAFFSRGPELAFSEQLRAFTARPQWDDVAARPTGAFELFDERTCTVSLGAPQIAAPFGYIEWGVRIDGVPDRFFVPVTRSSRTLALAILQTRRDARRNRTIAPATPAHPREEIPPPRTAQLSGQSSRYSPTKIVDAAAAASLLTNPNFIDLMTDTNPVGTIQAQRHRVEG